MPSPESLPDAQEALPPEELDAEAADAAFDVLRQLREKDPDAFREQSLRETSEPKR